MKTRFSNLDSNPAGMDRLLKAVTEGRSKGEINAEIAHCESLRSAARTAEERNDADAAIETLVTELDGVEPVERCEAPIVAAGQGRRFDATEWAMESADVVLWVVGVAGILLIGGIVGYLIGRAGVTPPSAS